MQPKGCISFFCDIPVRGVGRISQETRPAPLPLAEIARPGPSAHAARPGTLCAGLRFRGPQRATERAPRPLALTGHTSPHPTLRGARAPRLLRGRAATQRRSAPSASVARGPGLRPVLYPDCGPRWPSGRTGGLAGRAPAVTATHGPSRALRAAYGGGRRSGHP